MSIMWRILVVILFVVVLVGLQIWYFIFFPLGFKMTEADFLLALALETISISSFFILFPRLASDKTFWRELFNLMPLKCISRQEVFYQFKQQLEIFHLKTYLWIIFHVVFFTVHVTKLSQICLQLFGILDIEWLHISWFQLP